MITVQQQRQVAVDNHYIAFDSLSEEGSASALSAIADVRGPETWDGSKVHRREITEEYAELLDMVGNREVQERMRTWEILAKMQPVHVTRALSNFDIKAADKATSGNGQFQDFFRKLGRFYAIGKAGRAYEGLKKNAVVYDGQQFFDTDHLHPHDEGAVVSNLRIVGAGDGPAARAIPEKPTPIELAAELDFVASELQEQQITDAGIIETTEVRKDLVIIARGSGVHNAFLSLYNKDKIGGESNTYQGTFRLLRDLRPMAGTNGDFDAFWVPPGAVKPCFVQIGEEPTQIEFAAADAFAEKSRYSLAGIMAFAWIFWQAGIRILHQ